MQYKLSNSVPVSIFRAYDIRGIVGDTLTPDVVYTIGLAIGSEIITQGEHRVVIARDGRLSGPLLIRALNQGLCDSGCNVLDIGAVPTPVLYFATHVLPIRSGVMLTGSHNPPDYNGLKIVICGETLAEEGIYALFKRIQACDFVSGQGNSETFDITPTYLARVTQDINIQRKLRVVIDCGHGITGNIAPQLMKKLGCEVIELFCEVDGHFPHHHPDPSIPENLQDLIQAVRHHQADVGLAFDGDGDRLGVVTNKSEIIWPDRQLILYAIDVLKRNPGAKIIYDVKCTSHLAHMIREYGGEPFMWKTGHSLIKGKLREMAAPLAGEMSGHIFFKERWYGFDDGLYAAARLLEILAADKRSPSEIFATLPDSINTPELKLPLAEEQKNTFMEKFKTKAQFHNAKITSIDGLRADFKDGWGLIRASNTTPCLVLRFEASNEKNLKKIQDFFREQLLAIDANLNLPF